MTASVSASRVAPARVGPLRRATAPSTASNERHTAARMVSAQAACGADPSTTSTAQPATTLTRAARKAVTKSAGAIRSASRLPSEPATITTVATPEGSTASHVPCPRAPVKGVTKPATATPANTISKTTYMVKRRARGLGECGASFATMVGAYEKGVQA